MHEQLQATVEELRLKGFPHLDPELVTEILDIERDSLDARAGVLNRVEQAIDAALASSDTQ